MNIAASHENDRIWLGSYMPGVPADIDDRIDEYASLSEVFLEHMQKYRERVAYVSIGSDMTYDECERKALAFAAWLQANGVGKGDRVALMMPNCLQYPVCLFGTLLAGAVVVNVNPLYTARELRHLLDDSGAETVVIFENFARTLEQALDHGRVKRVLVTGIGDLLGGLKGVALNFVLRHVQKQVPAYRLPNSRRLTLALKEGASMDARPVDIGHDDLAFLQYTGGTTGDAKGVMLTHRNIIAT